MLSVKPEKGDHPHMTASVPYPSEQDVDRLLAAQNKRRDIARLGAYAQHAKYDPKVTTRAAFEARMQRYRDQVDPTGELAKRDPQALAKRVDSALKADMRRVRLARTQRAEARADADARRTELLRERLRQIPSNELLEVLDAAAALAVDITESALLNEEPDAAHTAHTEAAPALTETAPMPQSSGNSQKIVSSDSGADSVSPTPRRRQTTTPKNKGTEKKAAHRGNSKRTTLHN